MARVLIVSARVGAGHDGAAKELDRWFAGRGAEVVRADFLDLLPGRTGELLCGAYHQQLNTVPRSWDWLLSALGTPVLAGAARRFAGLATPRLRELLAEDTDVVVSTYPLATHAVARLRRSGELTAPLVVYLTDPSVHRLCVSSEASLTVAPNETAARQAEALGAPRTLVSRPLVAPAFRPCTSLTERMRLRLEFGLPRDGALALVVAGSWGVGQIGQTAADLLATGQVEPVVVCGRNEALAERLREAGHRHVFGWVDRMPELMRACTVVVQNAGGLTTSEALATGLPVLTYRCLPGHGRANAAVLHDDGIVPWVRSPQDLTEALEWLLRRPVEVAG
ncbi:glycosyltransferase [Amycolatopsis benzoatilytica]|uniref:glycosyltransferase n=1 Tax=Amycolatopsis benzoatilytica TaxID=346045 RepID=UPI00037A6BBD|nr:glycosyltransferase [Amycolatopsis benzoatilytica]